MQAMQYVIKLPADYDMAVIRHRVATRAAALDGFPGLGLKAYLIRDKQYAPFYLWNDPDGMNRFLWTGGFRGIVTDFGRPTVRHWIGLAYAAGSRSELPTTATRHVIAVPEDVDPQRFVTEAVEHLDPTGSYCTALAVDPDRWELVRFTLWAGEPGEGTPGTRYEVLRLNVPELDQLAGSAPGRWGGPV